MNCCQIKRQTALLLPSHALSHLLCSMVVDTIKKHKDFNSSAPEYVAAYKVRVKQPGMLSCWLGRSESLILLLLSLICPQMV